MKLTYFLPLIILAASCGPTKKTSEETAATEEPAKKYNVYKAPESPQFPESVLTKNDVTVIAKDSTYAVDFNFDVTGFELGVQTSDAETRGIANSGKGQHIHFIVNNGPYSAHYMPGVSNELTAGNYVILAFLSRSYHESVKSAGAYYIQNLTVGEVEPVEADLTTQHLFFSRPKGTYVGADTEKLMLDFYLLNTTISPDGNKVKATINGEEYMITEWAPYYVEGLEKGTVTIKLELIDKDGNAIPGPFNIVERTVTLE
ncbi:MAG: hypothetical protein ACJA2C_000360 [Marinoscillum sp.]|jgi:hypothetical protein